MHYLIYTRTHAWLCRQYTYTQANAYIYVYIYTVNLDTPCQHELCLYMYIFHPEDGVMIPKQLMIFKEVAQPPTVIEHDGPMDP